jgi:hypothetical protein
VSVWSRNRPVDRERDAERYAIELLAGVGGDLEWWNYSQRFVGQLRVVVTAEEYAKVPPGCVVGDAGVTGPQRPRSAL